MSAHDEQVEQQVEALVERGATVLRLSYDTELTMLPLCVRRLAGTLEELYLDNNYCLHELPAVVGELRRLRRLDVSYSGLTHMDERVARLGKLEVLYLSNNHLTFLPPELGQLAALQELRLDNNALRVLPGGLLFLPRLCDLTLENNPLYTFDDVDGCTATSLVPAQRSVNCANCCVRTRKYHVIITFHDLCAHHALPFVFFTCSDVCTGHLHTRLRMRDEAQSAQAAPTRRQRLVHNPYFA